MTKSHLLSFHYGKSEAQKEIEKIKTKFKMKLNKLKLNRVSSKRYVKENTIKKDKDLPVIRLSRPPSETIDHQGTVLFLRFALITE